MRSSTQVSSKSTTDSSDSGASRPKRGKTNKILTLLRMKESRVLVLNLTNAVTELCRHLVLSGINMELVNDSVSVEPHHSQTDFLFDSQNDQLVSKSIKKSFIEGHCGCLEAEGNEPLC